MENSVDKKIQVIFENKRKKDLEVEEVHSKKIKTNVEEEYENIKKEDTIKKCTTCKKKLKISSNYVCRCGNNFCNKHRFFDQHGCSFDYKTKALEKLKLNNPKIINRRLRE